MAHSYQPYWWKAAAGSGAIGIALLSAGVAASASKSHLSWTSDPLILGYVFSGIAVVAFMCGVRELRFPLVKAPPVVAAAEPSADHALMVRVNNFDMQTERADSHVGGRLPGILLNQLLRLDLEVTHEEDSRKSPIHIWQTRTDPDPWTRDHFRLALLVTGYVEDADTPGRFAAAIRVSLVKEDGEARPLLVEEIEFEDTKESMTEALGDLATRIWHEAMRSAADPAEEVTPVDVTSPPDLATTDWWRLTPTGMRQRPVIVTALGLFGLVVFIAVYFIAVSANGTGGPASSLGVSAAVRWGHAIALPGTDGVVSVSCASAGNCAVGGSYVGGSGGQAVVASEVNGTWRTAIEVPGTAALNSGKNVGASADSVSCRSAGNCAAVGSYTDASGHQQAFVASEANGTWHKAIEVPGTAALNTGATAKNLGASADSVSCASAGNCAAVGSYTDASGGRRAFVVGEVNGTWRKAIEVPGTAALSTGATAQNLDTSVNSVSCPSAGNCAAVGWYTAASGWSRAFVASEVNGTWHKAIDVPGTAALSTGALSTGATAVSCPSAGTCAAGGFYSGGSGHEQAFVASEVNGTWHKAIEVPGTAALNTGATGFRGAWVQSVSCGSAGNCAAGGFYTGASGGQQAFVASKVNGTWHKAIEVPGTAALNTGASADNDGAWVRSVSCGSAGNCAAGGFYTGASGGQQAFVASKVNGTWHKAIEVPGSGSLNTGSSGKPLAEVSSVSCPPAGNCAAGGYYYTGGYPLEQGFVTDERRPH